MIDDIKIKGFDSLIKRNKSSVINTDADAYNAAKKRRQRAIDQEKNNKDVQDVIKRTGELEQKIDNIQDILTNILLLLSDKK